MLPEIFLSISVVFLLTVGVIYSKLDRKYSQQKKLTWVSIIILIFTFFISLAVFNSLDSSIVIGFFIIQPITMLIKMIILIGTILILLLSLEFYTKEKFVEFEYPFLILFASLGMLLLVSSNNLLIFYLSIELFSLSLYVLAAIFRSGEYSSEAGLKYFLLGALSSGILLFGCSLLYLLSGEIDFYGISSFIYFSTDQDLLEIAGFFIIVGILFKLAVAPFHSWAPDVYEGAATIVTAFFAIVPKIATLGILISLLFGPFFGIFEEFQLILSLCVIFSLLIGSLGGINQSKFKRLFAYSAISHVGFMLLGILPGSLSSLHSTFIYIILYIIMSFNTFSILLTLFQGSSNFITQVSGISRFHPILAITFAFNLLSLAGIPPLAGFFSKFLVLLSAINHQFYIISIIAVLTSVISCFYYLRIIKWMYFKHSDTYSYKSLGDLAILPSQAGSSSIQQAPDLAKSLILGSTFYLILTILLFPNPLFIFTFDCVAKFLI